MNLETYPQRIVKPLIELEKTTDLAAEHKLLLDLGETLLTHITGIIFGEYKRNWDIDEALESEFYRNAKKKPSFGVFLGLLRLLMKADGKSVCDEYFEKGKSYPAVSEFVFNYNLLKSEVVNKGHDSGFKEVLEPLKKGRTVASKSGLDFFESFVAVRNTYAHPEEKAKNPLRNWPMGDEYYGLINPLMKEALMELISGFTVLSTHRPVLVKEIDDQQHKGSFIEEIGKKEKDLGLELSDEDLDFVNTDVRYLLDQDNKLFSKFYQAEVPQVNPSVAKQIIEKEKAKMMEPVLLDMIRKKLEDGVIDELEYMVLKDTAITSFITEEKLKKLIEDVKKELNIDGNVYVTRKKKKTTPTLNPWWIRHIGGMKDSTVEKNYEKNHFLTTHIHWAIWKEISNYLEFIIENNLNDETQSFTISSNQFQIGRLSYTYWGKIYPDRAPLGDLFHIGFALSQKYKWAKARKKGLLFDRINKPSLLIWTSWNDNLADKIDPDNYLLTKYDQLNFELLKREKDLLTRMEANIRDNSGEQGLDGEFKRMDRSAMSEIQTISEFFKKIGESSKTHLITLYSKIYNLEDFYDDLGISFEKTLQIEEEIVAFMKLSSNLINQVNDYAIENGVT